MTDPGTLVRKARAAGEVVTAAKTAVYAAGGVVWRVADGKLRVLLVHRTKYRDVSLPKGKVDPGETLAETAVREIREETGIRIHLGVPVGVSRYPLPHGSEKIVHYWAAEAPPSAVRDSTFVPNSEIAAIEWAGLKKARRRLSYPADLEILEEFARLIDDGVLATFPLIVLRHAKAMTRREWAGQDTARPLTARGRRQAAALVGQLQAFGPQRIVSSPAVRCLRTVGPLARRLGQRVATTPLIGQDAWESGRSDARSVVGAGVRDRRAAVLCSHGPVLPDILTELALATGTLRGAYLGSASALPVGAFSVVHLSATNPGSGIVAIETHEPKV